MKFPLLSEEFLLTVTSEVSVRASNTGIPVYRISG